MGDFVLSVMQEGGRFKCHGNTILADFELDGSGDIAIEDDEWAQFLQEFRVWFGTRLGERLNPKLGCIIHAYQFSKTTTETLASLELGLIRNIRENFPRFKSVTVNAIPYDAHNIYIRIRVDNKPLAALVDEDSLKAYEYGLRARFGRSEGPTNG